MKTIYRITIFLLLAFLGNSFAVYANDRSKQVEALLEKAEPLFIRSGYDELDKIKIELEKIIDKSDKKNYIKYLHFKGGLEKKKGNYEYAFESYSEALTYCEPTDYLLLAISYSGISDYYQYIENRESEEKYSNKFYNAALKSKDKVWIVYAASTLIELYIETDRIDLAENLLKVSISTDPENVLTKLQRANVYIIKGNIGEGIESLWSIVINDPKYENIATAWALIVLTDLYLEISNLERCEEIINLILENKGKFEDEIVGDFYLRKGILQKKQGDFNASAISLKKALAITTKSDVREDILLALFPLESKDWSINYLENYVNAGLLHPDFMNSETGLIIQMILELKFSNKKHKALAYNQLYAKFETDEWERGKQIFVLQQLQRTKIDCISTAKVKIVNSKLRSLVEQKKYDERIMANKFLNATKNSFDEHLQQRQSKIEEKNNIIVQEQKLKQSYLNFGLWSVTALLIVIVVVIVIFLDRRKIKKLNSMIQIKNDDLAKFSEEYQILLMILGHQVKNPIHQLHYTLEDIIEKTKDIDDADLNKYLKIIKSGTAELSNRVGIILSMIKCGSTLEAIEISEITLYSLIMERIEYFREYFEEKSIRLNLNVSLEIKTVTNADYLSIILDNLFENIKKYGIVDDEIFLDISKKKGKIIMEIRNRFSNEIKDVDLDNKHYHRQKSNFGLGYEIISKLCRILNIKFKSRLDGNMYSTQLIFDAT